MITKQTQTHSCFVFFLLLQTFSFIKQSQCKIKKYFISKRKSNFEIHRTSGLANPSYQADGVRYTASPRMQQLQGQVDEVEILEEFFLIRNLILGYKCHER